MIINDTCEEVNVVVRKVRALVFFQNKTNTGGSYQYGHCKNPCFKINKRGEVYSKCKCISSTPVLSQSPVDVTNGKVICERLV